MNSRHRTQGTKSSRKDEEEEEYNKFMSLLRSEKREFSRAPEGVVESVEVNPEKKKKKKGKKNPVVETEQKLVVPLSKRLKTSRGSEVVGMEVVPPREAEAEQKKKKKKKAAPPKRVNKTSNCNVVVQDAPRILQRVEEELLDFDEGILDPMEEEGPRGSSMSSPGFAYSPTYATSPNFAKIMPVHSYPNFLSVLSTKVKPSLIRGSVPLLSALQSEGEDRSRSPSPEREESGSNTEASSDERVYSCPFCEDGGFSEVQLTAHIFENHPKDKHNKQAVCPVCSSRSNGDPNYVSRDFFGHLKLRHSGQPPDSVLQRLSRATGTLSFRPAEIITRSPRNVFLGSMALGGMGLGRGLERGRDISELLWDYVLTLDSQSSAGAGGASVNAASNSPCDECFGVVDSLAQTRAVLPCGHTFHAECAPTPLCPVCNKKPPKKGKVKKKRASRATTGMEL